MVDWSINPDKEDEDAYKKYKSEAEIEKYTLSEVLSNTERVLMLLKLGTEEQQKAALNNVSMYLAEPEFLPQVFPKLLDAIKNWPSHMQRYCAFCAEELLLSGVLSRENSEKLMRVVLSVLESGSEEDVNSLWPTFCIGLRSVDWTFVEAKLLPVVIAMAGYSYTSLSRNAAAHIITAACILTTERKLENTKLTKIYLDLCCDTVLDIRHSSLRNMRLLISKLEPSQVEPTFLGELGQHLHEGGKMERYIVYDLILSFQHLFSTIKLEKEIVPWLMKEFEKKWKYNDNWLLVNCGKVVSFMMTKKLLTGERPQQLASYFSSVIHSKDLSVYKVGLHNCWAFIRLFYEFNVGEKYWFYFLQLSLVIVITIMIFIILFYLLFILIIHYYYDK